MKIYYLEYFLKNAGKLRFRLEFWVFFLSFQFLEFLAPWVFSGVHKKKPALNTTPGNVNGYLEDRIRERKRKYWPKNVDWFSDLANKLLSPWNWHWDSVHTWSNTGGTPHQDFRSPGRLQSGREPLRDFQGELQPRVEQSRQQPALQPCNLLQHCGTI